MKKIIPLILVLLFIFGGCKKTAKKPNILLVTIDTLRMDHMSCYGYSRKTTPFIDSLAKNGKMFTRVITPLPATDASHASILTGLHPVSHNVITNSTVLSEKVETIAEVLKDNGYYTIGTVAVEHMSSKYNFDQGFASFSDSWSIREKYNSPHARTARSVNKSLGQQLDKYLSGPDQDKPLFIWVHYFDPHRPYLRWEHVKFDNPVPMDYQQKFPDNVKFVDAYDSEIRYVDQAVEQLLQYLTENNLAQNLVTCITSDHGEQFGDHGIFNDHADFYSEITFVPLILSGRGTGKAEAAADYISTMDIPVTLLDFAGLKFSSAVEGINLFTADKKALSGRDFFVLGYPSYTKSLQLIRPGNSYIKNLDAGLKHLYYSYSEKVPGLSSPGLTPLDPGKIRYRKSEKQQFEALVELPDIREPGEYFLICRLKVNKNPVKTIEVLNEPRLSLGKLEFPAGSKYCTLYIPSSFADELTLLIKGTGKSELQVSCAKISKKGFLTTAEDFVADLKSQKTNVFKNLRTLRRESIKDEMYDLTEDFYMNNPLPLNQGQIADTLNLKKKMLYYYLKYRQKREKILGAVKKGKKYTSEEIKKLKSLGYL